MSVLFLDGVVHYTSTADLDRKWDESSSGFTIEASGGRFDGPRVVLDGTDQISKTVGGTSTTMVVGFAWKPTSTFDSVITFNEGSTFHVTINIEPGGVFMIERNNTIEIGRSGLELYKVNQWQYIEVKVLIGDGTSGRVTIRLDGVEVFDLQNVDTRNGETGIIDRIQIFETNGYYHDFYIEDVDFLGDIRVETLIPDNDGFYTEFGTTVPTSPSTHWDKVEEIGPDSDTSYNEGAAANQRDTFTMSNLVGSGTKTIKAVQQVNYAKHDGTATNHRTKLRLSGVDHDGASKALTSVYEFYREIWDIDPQTGLAWTEAGINAMESGYEEL